MEQPLKSLQSNSFKFAFMFMLLTVVSQIALGNGNLSCATVLALPKGTNRHPYDQLDPRSHWASRYMTNPAAHQENKFQYLIHSHRVRIDKYSLKEVYNYLLINDSGRQRVLSLSVIDENHRKSYAWTPADGNVAFIVEALPSQIVGTAPADMRTEVSLHRFGRNIEELIKQFEPSIQTPDEILKHTWPSQHNEIVVRNGPMEGLKIVGLIRFRNSFEYHQDAKSLKMQSLLEESLPERKLLFEEAERLTKELNIPLIDILTATDWAY